MKRMFSSLLVLAMLLAALAGCGGENNALDAENSPEADGTSEMTKVLKLGETWSAPMDAQSGWNGWYTSLYGITETLFKVDDDYSVVPWLADSYSTEGNTWTITLKDGLVFSNGKPVTAQVVVDNLKRVAEVNERAVVLAAAQIEAVDEKTLTVTTSEIYPTLKNDLADPYTSILDLDDITDFENTIIATGPMKLESYTQDSEVVVVRNENYWGGDVKLDKAVIYCIPDEETQGMSLQNGEIDLYVEPTSDYIKLFSEDDNFKVVSTPQTRQHMFFFNLSRMTDGNIRKAVAMAMDRDTIVDLLGGTVDATYSPFGMRSPYGQVTEDSFETEGACKLIEESGYIKNADGYYEKDGKVLTLDIAYYSARSLDKICVLMQDQMKAIGIMAELSVYERASTTYLATGDYDIGMYCAVSDSTGDPYAFLADYLATGGSSNFGGYSNAEVDALLAELSVETDTATRARLANEIQQIAIDDRAYCFLTIFNKVTVMKDTVSNVCENNPLTIYAITADTDIQ